MSHHSSAGLRRSAPRSALVPLAAGLSVVCAATSLTGVVTGLSWLWYLIAAVVVVVSAGHALRSLRTPDLVVSVGQLVALLLLVTALFSQHALALIVPSPASFGDLIGNLQQSIGEIQTKAPPVTADPPLLCLMTVAIGLVAVAVDTFAASVRAPAAAGLVLLCIYAIPASLSADLLPWWSFFLGASAFGLVLAVAEYDRRAAWRGRGQRYSALAGAPLSVIRLTGVTRITTVILGAAIIALVIGAEFTVIGTAGRLPGLSAGSGGDQVSIGIKPFTKLSGLLDQQNDQELFRVYGLPADSYLRAVTLSDYVPNDGWVIGKPPSGGIQLDGDSVASTVANGVARIRIDPVGWQDIWVPIYGTPLAVSNLDNSWRYDETTGTIYGSRAQHLNSYVETARLTEPTADELRADDGKSSSGLDTRYRAPIQISARALQLTQSITRSASTTFDKASAIYRYFTNGVNGFRYTVQDPVRDPHSDQLDDFLFNSRAGFCEQYASAMAAMLRAIGVPTRVAIGFTAGYTPSGSDYRSIRSSDAHAWVEVYFPEDGWIRFDPTPLGEGRAVTPPYLQDGSQPRPAAPLPSAANPSPSNKGVPGDSTSHTPESPKNALPVEQYSASTMVPPWFYWATGLVIGLTALGILLIIYLGRTPHRGQRRWFTTLAARRRLMYFTALFVIVCWILLVLLLVSLCSLWIAVGVLAGIALVTPWTFRTIQRRHRENAIAEHRQDAADLAWQELVAEVRDRGGSVSATDTIRVSCRRIADQFHLDESGKQALRQLITAVERARYGNDFVPDNQLTQVLAQLQQSFHRNAPIPLLARLFPRSVLTPVIR